MVKTQYLPPALGFLMNSLRSHFALTLLSGYALVTHFGHSRRAQNHRSFWGAFLQALKSRTMHGTLLASGVMSFALRRAFNLPPGRMFIVFFSLVWSLIYRWRVVENPTISFRRTYWNSTLVEKAKIAETPFAPVLWGFNRLVFIFLSLKFWVLKLTFENRHAQTISLYALSQLEWLWAEPIKYTREEIPAFDPPNVLFLDWAKAGDSAKHKIIHQQGNDAPVVLFIHGLGDDREIPYMKRCVRLCLQRGYRAVVFSCKP